MIQEPYRDANSAMLCGELAAKPSLKRGRSVTYAQLSLKVSRGKTMEEFRVALFGGDAEAALSTLAQGDRVAVFGRLAMRERTSRDGARYQSLAFQAEGFLKMPTSPRPEYPDASPYGARDTFCVGPDFLAVGPAAEPEPPF